MPNNNKAIRSNPLENEDMDVVQLPITDELDLHTFNPKEVKHLIPDYIEACLEKKIYTVRIIHGKGKGHMQRSVHALLKRNPNVLTFKLGNETSGSWGATTVELKRLV